MQLFRYDRGVIFMDGFFQTPMAQFYAEVSQGMASGKRTTAGGRAGESGKGDFAAAVQEKIDEKEKAVQAMSMEQYKLYIYQKILGFSMNRGQGMDTVSVSISEEGFAAMKADPLYEKWVLDTLRNEFSSCNLWNACGGGYCRVYYFGAGKEEYRAESYSAGFRNRDRRRDAVRKKKEKSFWEKRAERHKLYMDLAQKAWYRRENERKFQEQIAFGRKEVSSAVLKQHAIERATGEQVELDANPSVLSKAATEFAQDYVFFRIPSARINPRPKTGK